MHKIALTSIVLVVLIFNFCGSKGEQQSENNVKQMAGRDANSTIINNFYLEKWTKIDSDISALLSMALGYKSSNNAESYPDAEELSSASTNNSNIVQNLQNTLTQSIAGLGSDVEGLILLVDPTNKRVSKPVSIDELSNNNFLDIDKINSGELELYYVIVKNGSQATNFIRLMSRNDGSWSILGGTGELSNESIRTASVPIPQNSCISYPLIEKNPDPQPEWVTNRLNLKKDFPEDKFYLGISSGLETKESALKFALQSARSLLAFSVQSAIKASIEDQGVDFEIERDQSTEAFVNLIISGYEHNADYWEYSKRWIKGECKTLYDYYVLISTDSDFNFEEIKNDVINQSQQILGGSASHADVVKIVEETFDKLQASDPEDEREKQIEEFYNSILAELTCDSSKPGRLEFYAEAHESDKEFQTGWLLSNEYYHLSYPPSLHQRLTPAEALDYQNNNMHYFVRVFDENDEICGVWRINKELFHKIWQPGYLQENNTSKPTEVAAFGGQHGVGNPMIQIQQTANYPYVATTDFCLGDGTENGGGSCKDSDHPYCCEDDSFKVSLAGFKINKYEVTNQEFTRNFYDFNDDGTTNNNSCYFDGTPLGPSGLSCKQAWNAALVGTGRTLILIDGTGVHISEDSTELSDYNPTKIDINSGAGSLTNKGGKSSYWFAAKYSNRNSTVDAPIVNISWYEARAYCKYVYGVNADLPTEAQWERAAKGTTSTRSTYPWGTETPDCTRAYYEECNSDGTAQVGSLAAGKTAWDSGIELFDMAGNVWEWCLDWRNNSFYGSSGKDWNKGLNPIKWSKGSSSSRVLRGGSWNNNARNLLTAFRFNNYPNGRYLSIGFRCVINDPSTKTSNIDN